VGFRDDLRNVMKLLDTLQKKLLCALPKGLDAHHTFLGIEKIGDEITSPNQSKYTCPLFQ